MKTLLKTCLQSLAVLLEIQLPQEISDSIKLIEELVTYLATLINFMPAECIQCIKHLLNYMFMMNFISRTNQYEYLIENQFGNNVAEHIGEVFDFVKELKNYNGATATTTAAAAASSIASGAQSTPTRSGAGGGGTASSTGPSAHLSATVTPSPSDVTPADAQTSASQPSSATSKLVGIMTIATSSNDNKSQSIVNNIKLFEPIVIQCLKVSRIFFN